MGGDPSASNSLFLRLGSASTPGTALPGGERSARLSAGLRDSAGRDGSWAAASRPRRPRAFISSAPARLPALHSVPASAPPRGPGAPDTPPAPRARTTRQPSGLGLASGPKTPTPSIALELPLGVHVGTGRGCFSPADPAGAPKKHSLVPGYPGSTPRATAPCAAGETFALLLQM